MQGKCKNRRKGTNCSFPHPIIIMCFRFVRSGNKGFNKGSSCQYAHPKLCKASLTSKQCDRLYNVYTSSSLDRIGYSRHVLDLGIYVSSDCSFSNFILLTLIKEKIHLTGWILRTFSAGDKLTMLTLFTTLVMSRLDYGSQLWSPYLTKHINMIEKTQLSLSRYISGMKGLSYPERHTVLKLYSLQHR